MSDMSQHALHMRREILRLALKAGANGAHIAPSLSCVEILATLYGRIINTAKIVSCQSDRDRVILGKGHAGLALYVALAEFGLISRDVLNSFEVDGSGFAGQPTKNIASGIDFASGSLGMGLPFGAGIAVANRGTPDGCVYVVCGDGELNEGSVWESAMFAGTQHLENLTVIVDCNGMQSDGFTDQIIQVDTAGMFASCGFDVRKCDGHDVDALEKAIKANRVSKPVAVIAKTIKGKGVSFMENNRAWHHSRLSEKQYADALAELGGMQ